MAKTRDAKTLDGRVAIITGAAQGSGRGAALEFAREGARCVLVGRRLEPLEALAQEIKRLGADALPLSADVGDRAAIRAVVAKTVAAFGTVDILVNAAQSPSMRSARLLDVTDEVVDQLWRTGAVATLEFMRACHPHMKGTGRGSIINFGSGAQVTPAHYGLYAGVKSAIHMISRAAAVEWGPDRIRVNVVAPMVNSPANDEAMAADPGLRDLLIRTIPLGRIGDPEKDIGRALVFLAGDDSRFITGGFFMLDGGQQFY